MSHKLTPARQNAILSHCNWTGQSSVRVQSTLKTEPLLRSAGVSHPRALEWYPVPVRRDNSGFLVIDHDAGKHAPQSEGNDELYQAGGLFAGEKPPAETIEQTAPVNFPKGLPFFAELRETLNARRFEITTGPHTRIRVEIVAFEDKSLPSPSESEQWIPQEPTNTEVHAAVSALYMARELSHFEKI
ncbi:MAG: hypothetical protein ABIT37_03815 [Luteolibacter sp.]